MRPTYSYRHSMSRYQIGAITEFIRQPYRFKYLNLNQISNVSNGNTYHKSMQLFGITVAQSNFVKPQVHWTF